MKPNNLFNVPTGTKRKTREVQLCKKHFVLLLYLWTCNGNKTLPRHLLKQKLHDVCIMPSVLPSRSLAPGRKGLSYWSQGGVAVFAFCFQFWKSVCDAGKHHLKSILLLISYICHKACCKPECECALAGISQMTHESRMSLSRFSSALQIWIAWPLLFSWHQRVQK